MSRYFIPGTRFSSSLISLKRSCFFFVLDLFIHDFNSPFAG